MHTLSKRESVCALAQSTTVHLSTPRPVRPADIGRTYERPKGKGREGKDSQVDLLALETDPEGWLINRLKWHGVDIYAGSYACWRDRIGNSILNNRFGMVVVGRHNGKPETYEQVFERIYNLKLKDVPRGTAATPAKQAKR